MAIMLGSNALDNCKIGANQVDKIYLGSSEIWTHSSAPSWFTDTWYNEAKSKLNTEFSFKPADGAYYFDIVCDYKRISDNADTQCIIRSYFWTNPSQPIEITADQSFTSNNNYWWRGRQNNSANDYWRWGVFYKIGSNWTTYVAPRSDELVLLPMLEYSQIYAPYTKKATNMTFVGGTVNVNITKPSF